MIELNRMSDLMQRHFHNRVFPTDINDNEFFRNLPVQARDQSTKRLTNDKNDGKGDKKSKKISRKSVPKKDLSSSNGGKVAGKTDKTDRDDRHAFSTYSFSDPTVVDDKGRQVTSMRRRYEDSSGRLKAGHERQVEGKKLRTTWDRNSKEDKGRLESVCSSGTPDEFEAMWLNTPIGRGEKKIVKEQGEKSPQNSELETRKINCPDRSCNCCRSEEYKFQINGSDEY